MENELDFDWLLLFWGDFLVSFIDLFLECSTKFTLSSAIMNVLAIFFNNQTIRYIVRLIHHFFYIIVVHKIYSLNSGYKSIKKNIYSRLNANTDCLLPSIAINTFFIGLIFKFYLESASLNFILMAAHYFTCYLFMCNTI